MDATEKVLQVPIELKADPSAEGEFRAVVSTFDVLDKDRDVVESTALPSGLKLAGLWAHKSFEMPVALGTISHATIEAKNRGIVSGRFLTETSGGRDAHATVKALAAEGINQELSWGFRVTDFKVESEHPSDGEPFRRIIKSDPREFSFVLRGAGEDTGVLAVKSAACTHEGKPEISELLVESAVLNYARGDATDRAAKHAHLATHFAELGIDAPPLVAKGEPISFLEEAAIVTADSAAFSARALARIENRAKNDRTLSAAQRDAVNGFLETGKTGTDALDQVLKADEPEIVQDELAAYRANFYRTLEQEPSL
jgi:HK97 family phage prohead protease